MIYEVKNLSFSYPGAEDTVLNDISFSVDKGEILTILGRNGSGKSTLLNCILGLLEPQKGLIMLKGKDISGLNEKEIAQFVGFVPQIYTSLFSYSVMDYVLTGFASQTGLFSRPNKPEYIKAEETLRLLEIGYLKDKPFTEISGGERQKTLIARAIVSNPSIILFDEPTAHLDFGSQLLVLKLIKGLSKSGYAVIITTHNPDHALLLGGKTALIDDNGFLSYGPVDEIITQENLSKIYNTEIKLEYIKSLGRKTCLYTVLN